MNTNKFHKTKVKTIHFLNKTKTIYNKTEKDIKQLNIHLISFHQMMKIIITKIIDNFIKTKDYTLTT